METPEFDKITIGMLKQKQQFPPPQETSGGPGFEEWMLQSESSGDQMDHDAEKQGLIAFSQANLLPGSETKLSPSTLAKRLTQAIWEAAAHKLSRVKASSTLAEQGDLMVSVKLLGKAVYVDIRALDPQVVRLLYQTKDELAESLKQKGLSLGSFSASAMEQQSERTSGDSAKASIMRSGHEAGSAPDGRRSSGDARAEQIQHPNGKPVYPRRSFIEVVI